MIINLRKEGEFIHFSEIGGTCRGRSTIGAADARHQRPTEAIKLINLFHLFNYLIQTPILASSCKRCIYDARQLLQQRHLYFTWTDRNHTYPKHFTNQAPHLLQNSFYLVSVSSVGVWMVLLCV